jgi:superfamily I DNA and/or RNA helicase/very-short-patch-repair endonuclease
MSESILPKLEASRKELLDLGLRNPLINYKRPKSKGLQITDEKSSSIFELLVKQGKAMSFLGKAEQTGPEIEFTEPTPDELEIAYTDTKLQTNETEMSLQNKLLAVYYAAKTSLEEQGVNILYITLGMLQWYEAENSEEPKLAPLILVPVSLDRSSARERFRVRYSLEDVGHNLSFQAKLKAEFGISLPDLGEVDELSIEEYFSQVSQLVKNKKNWEVIPDHIELGFFSFGKFMIYHDLDNSKWPEEAKPIENSILQSLFKDGFTGVAPQFGDETFVDKETKAHELYQVVDADSSQILAMLAVQEGKNIIIQGPPGTGKSQTITNLIANAIGSGKKVLFVAEKMAALEVVKRRMDNIGLGEACLELHSHKANKKLLHEELKRVLELGKPSIQQLKEEVSLLEKNKEEINAYCLAVNSTIGKSGLTVQSIYGRLLNIADTIGESKLLKISIPNLDTWTADNQRAAEAMADKVQERLRAIGVPSELPFWGTGLRVLLPHEQEAFRTVLENAKTVVERVRAESKTVAEAIEFTVSVNREGVFKVLSMVHLASAKPDLKEINIPNKAWVLQKNDVEEILSSGKRLTELREEYAEILLPEAWEQNVLEIRQNIKEHGAKWYRFFIGGYTKAKKQLASFCKSDLPKDVATKLQYIDAVLESKRLEAILREHEVLVKDLFGSRWQKLRTDWNALGACFEYLKSIHQQIIDESCPGELLSYLEKQEPPAIAKKYYEALSAIMGEHGKCINEIVDKLKLDENLRFQNTLLHQLFINQEHLLEGWINQLPEVQLSISWNNLVDVAIEEDLQCLTDASTHWAEAKEFLKLALQKTWYEYLVEQATHQFAALRKFERSTHEEVIRQFKQLDRLSLQYNRAMAALKHWEELPNMEAGGQVRILKGEFNRKAKHMAIRKLMQEAGMAIQAIKPVFMMSPLSIANFLAPGTLEFDLVIFDEASQVRPVEALGAILRGKQLVVVGDTKQLPPTSFFDTLNDNVEDEENVTSDLQSILGMCDAQGAHQKMLRWHYRSRHESLITLSNHEFYENRLVVFPSPGSRHRMGLVFHHLAQTAYDRGQTRTNPKEAEYVAQKVMEHAQMNPKQSLGVVAFSSAQREAISNALELKRRANPGHEDFFKAHSDEPFFVKNLENVQGDERDVIFISIGYGKTKEGYLSMSFGPLNNDGGERRLNVLITRAKLRCEVFTNITAADIDLNKTQKRGITALKSFLHFAQFGKLDVVEETGKPFDSPFEENVASQLTKLGYTVRQQVGSQGFYLDLAIVDPEHPGRYLLGIECDGAAYHSARSARDRDRLRQQVLEGIGWRIHRIWSTDWFRYPERELKRVAEAIEKAKQVFYLDDELEEQYTIETSFSREKTEEENADVPHYQTATLPTELSTKELHLHSIGKLAGCIEDVVKVESPVHFDEVARRIVEAAGITRIGSRIRSQLQLAARFAEGSKRIKICGDFLWDCKMESPVVRNRAAFPPASKKIKFIAPEELSLAVEKVVKESIAIQPEAAVPFIAKLFGFSRVTEDMREEILNAVRSSLASNRILRDGELLKVV